MKILMVCLGNICRSPLAEGILQSKVADSIFVDSAGTAGYYEGRLPDSRSIDVAKKHGIDIANQKCRKFNVQDFGNFDLIYVMDQGNYVEVRNVSRNENDMQKVKMILNEVYPNSNKSVPDPYFGGDLGFENVYEMLDEACAIIVKKLQ
ncbi:low molecular weight protein-tyrosine-phosphatase [Tenacibaculum aquimarinum]|uniref:low molecular weight protein-tyrosine-phosphatase n=1 Tax=Tenacibaculum aquimarinum TaxID=2910675 RepID=UPI001F0B3F53|nr:low molecular weight protein-tyrosine-phosphatase [Tenacibaculum aquimarinum]MCH3885656.1 low molecular weight phosphotyrosine protein phosphatase [Tenacibaculum aquimarinum]